MRKKLQDTKPFTFEKTTQNRHFYRVLNFRFYISVCDYNAARWAKLKKIVIMDSQSEAFKQAEEQIKANKKAFKDKDKDKE